MGLRIANNIAAMNAHRWLQTSDSGLSKSLERLSSGYRINKAADDAAGLAISQGFRADIASFNVASRNTSEASSLLQVAEGGMDQIGNMLTRLKELATQAASSNVGSTERAKINAEGNALVSEIDRIAQNTKYGSTNLLDGTFGASKAAGTYSYSASSNAQGLGAYGSLTHVYCAAGTGEAASIFSGSFITSLTSGVSYSGAWTLSASGTTLTLGNGTVTESTTITAFSAAAAGNMTVSFANIGMTMSLTTFSTAATSTTIGNDTTISLRETGLTSLNVTGAASGTYTFAAANANEITIGNGTVTETVSNITPGTAKAIDFSTLGITFTVGTDYTEDDLEGMKFVVTDTGSSGNTFQVGAKNTTNDQISLSLGSVRATASTGLALSYDYLDTASEAQSMLDMIDSAVSTLASRRADVGAGQNRLSYAAANLATTVENMQAAESVIRDVDMAAEMTTFTKNQIMMQAGTAMLAQANMMPQQVLALFG